MRTLDFSLTHSHVALGYVNRVQILYFLNTQHINLQHLHLHLHQY